MLHCAAAALHRIQRVLPTKFDCCGGSRTLTARINNIAHVKNTGAVNRKRNVHNYFKDYCRGQKKNMRQIF